MKSLKAFAITCLGLASFAMISWADTWNKKTILTVNETIVVPGGDLGVTLPPGKYVMKLMDSPSNRHIVQVFNEEESRLLTTVLAIPNYRLQPTGDTKFTFWEVPAGQPKALRSWFYPGDNFGQEFVYSKPKAMEIAKFSHERVPMTTAQSETDLASARVGSIDQAGTEYELDRETYRAEETTVARSEETTVAQAQPAEQPAATPAPEVDNQADRSAAVDQGVRTDERADTGARTPMNELPATGSAFPLIGLLGALSLGAAGITRAIAKR